MTNDNFDEIIERSIKIRKLYHELELKQNGKIWTIEQDALGFLSDAGLVGRTQCLTRKRGQKQIRIQSWNIN